MKKLLILFLVVLGSTTSQSQNKQKASVNAPTAAKEAFSKAHPTITGTWEKEEGTYEVTFKESGKEMSCVIDKMGNILETETVIPANQLPAPVTDYIARHYKGIKVKEAATIVKADGSMLYEAEIKGKDVLFDGKGNLVKSKKDND